MSAIASVPSTSVATASTRTSPQSLPKIEPFGEAGLKPVFEALLAKHGLKMVALAQACRVSITGTTVSPPIFDVMEVLGRDESIARIRAGRAECARATA